MPFLLDWCYGVPCNSPSLGLFYKVSLKADWCSNTDAYQVENPCLNPYIKHNYVPHHVGQPICIFSASDLHSKRSARNIGRS